MKKSDAISLTTFMVLLVLICSVIIFNIYKNCSNEFVDRRIEYVFDDLTYNNVYEKSSKLFVDSISLLNNEDVYFYEKDNDNIKYYAINGDVNYKKILNFDKVTNTFKVSEVAKYMNLKKIISSNNDYYLKDFIKEKNADYIGSIVTFDSYDSNYAYFKSLNYYCEGYEYVGILENAPSNKCRVSNTNFTIIYENKKLRINDLEEIRKIFQ